MVNRLKLRNICEPVVSGRWMRKNLLGTLPPKDLDPSYAARGGKAFVRARMDVEVSARIVLP